MQMPPTKRLAPMTEDCNAMKLDKLVIILGAALFISLSCNLFLAGLMIGETVSHTESAADANNDASNTDAQAPDDKPPTEAEWRKKDAQLREKLNEADRNVIEAAKKDRKPVIDGLRKNLDDARAKVQAAQAAEPFDADALDAAVKGEADAKAALVTQMRAARQDVMQKLSPEGRETLKKFAPWKQGPGKGHRHPPRDPAHEPDHADAAPPPDNAAMPADNAIPPQPAPAADAPPAPAAPDAPAAPATPAPDYVQPQAAPADGTTPQP